LALAKGLKRLAGLIPLPSNLGPFGQPIVRRTHLAKRRKHSPKRTIQTASTLNLSAQLRVNRKRPFEVRTTGGVQFAMQEHPDAFAHSVRLRIHVLTSIG
jgi:hypothetical protein